MLVSASADTMLFLEELWSESMLSLHICPSQFLHRNHSEPRCSSSETEKRQAVWLNSHQTLIIQYIQYPAQPNDFCYLQQELLLFCCLYISNSSYFYLQNEITSLAQYEMLIIRLIVDLVKECLYYISQILAAPSIYGDIMMAFLFCFLKASLESLLMKR